MKRRRPRPKPLTIEEHRAQEKALWIADAAERALEEMARQNKRPRPPKFMPSSVCVVCDAYIECQRERQAYISLDDFGPLRKTCSAKCRKRKSREAKRHSNLANVTVTEVAS